MRQFLAVMFFALALTPGLAIADKKHDKGKHHGKDYWKHQDKWYKEQRKREQKFWKEHRDYGYYRQPYDYRGQRWDYPPPWYQPGPRYDSRYQDDDDWDSYYRRPQFQGRIGPYEFEVWR